jgi:hypothetical protein
MEAYLMGLLGCPLNRRGSPDNIKNLEMAKEAVATGVMILRQSNCGCSDTSGGYSDGLQ